MADQPSPNVYVVAGPNGAGKSTFARLYLPDYADCKEFVNADLIAAGLSPFNPESLAILFRLYAPLLDSCLILDTADRLPRRVALFLGTDLFVLDPEIFDRIEQEVARS